MFSDNGTRSPRSLQYWPMNHCVRNTTLRRSVFETLRNSEIVFLIIVSLQSGMENSIIQELNAEVDRIIGNKLLPAKSRQRYEQVYKVFIEWQNEKKMFFVFRENPHCVFQWKNLFPYLHKSCRVSSHNLFTYLLTHETVHFATVEGGVAPGPPTRAASRIPAPPSTCTPAPITPTDRMSAIISVTQAANFHEAKAFMQARVKFATLGGRGLRLSVISRGKNPRPSTSGSHSRARQLAITFDLLRRASRSSAFLTFASLRVMYYYLITESIVLHLDHAGSVPVLFLPFITIYKAVSAEKAASSTGDIFMRFMSNNARSICNDWNVYFMVHFHFFLLLRFHERELCF